MQPVSRRTGFKNRTHRDVLDSIRDRELRIRTGRHPRSSGVGLETRRRTALGCPVVQSRNRSTRTDVGAGRELRRFRGRVSHERPGSRVCIHDPCCIHKARWGTGDRAAPRPPTPDSVAIRGAALRLRRLPRRRPGFDSARLSSAMSRCRRLAFFAWATVPIRTGVASRSRLFPRGATANPWESRAPPR